MPLSPVRSAMARSDQWGWVRTMRSAAARRSALDSGSPCRMFSWTDRTYASA
ncbi:hypothetical protein [Streptomyces finlayi]|uniref:hypothetical protein n=1 Tax=Streptomyces finlayi TaxID=67296 RepID=UPI001E41760D|nr:hypothetical protein [Streptomyces finlayi]